MLLPYLLPLALCHFSSAQNNFMFMHPNNPQYFPEQMLDAVYPKEHVMVEQPRMRNMPNTGLVRLRGFKPTDDDVAKPVVHDTATMVKSEVVRPLKDISMERYLPDPESFPIQKDRSVSSEEMLREAEKRERTVDDELEEIATRKLIVKKDEHKLQHEKLKKFTNKVNVEPQTLDLPMVGGQTDEEGLDNEDDQDNMEKMEKMEKEEEEDEEKSYREPAEVYHLKTVAPPHHPSPSRVVRLGSSGERPLGMRNPNAKLISLNGDARVGGSRPVLRAFGGDSSSSSMESVRARPHRGLLRGITVGKSKTQKSSREFDPWSKV